jgi:hypothetical protein
MMRVALLIFCAFAAGCASRSSSNGPGSGEAGKGPMNPPATGCASASPELFAILDSQPIESFAPADGAGRSALTKEKVGADTLLAVGLDDTCASRVRLAAFEGWIAVVGEAALGAVDDRTATAIAAVHVEAIRTAEHGEPWGLPPDVTASAISRHLIVLGRRVLPQLRPLLDDHRELPYLGSETSAIASLRGYRVSDVAAGLIAVIVGAPYQNAQKPADRDPQLAQLRSAT